MKGEFSIIIVGPEGMALTGVINMAERDKPRSLSLDDKRLQELLVVNAILGAVIEDELVKSRPADPKASAPGAAPGKAFDQWWADRCANPSTHKISLKAAMLDAWRAGLEEGRTGV